MKNNKLKQLHRKIYQYNKKKALSFEADLGEDFVKYRKDQEKFSKRPFRSTTKNALIKSLKESKIIYLGDFHTFDQSSRNVLRILKTLKSNSKKSHFYLGLELVHYGQQKYIDSYVNGFITELEFLECIKYSESWRFPWNHYSPLFEWAIKENIKIIALNSKGSLNQRDQFASEIIASYVNNEPDSKFIVMFGEYHIVANKIPVQVQRRLEDTETKFTIIHQNLDEVYWKQTTKNLKKSKIVKFNDDEFSLQNSLPWIKYESMLYWYDNLSNDPDFDLHEYIMEEGVKTFGEDVDENFFFICKEALNVMNFQDKVDESVLSDYNLYDHTNFDYIVNTIETKVEKKLKPLNNYLIERNKVFSLGHKNIYYCPSYSVNRLTYLSGLHIHNSILIKKGHNPHNLLTNFKSENRFYFLTQRFFMAYCCTKIFNPHRKSDLYQDFKQKIRDPKTSSKLKKRLTTFLKILDNKENFYLYIKGLNLKEIFELARFMGHFLAENFFLKNSKFKGESSNKILSLIEPSGFFTRKQFKELKQLVLKDKSYKLQKKGVI